MRADSAAIAKSQLRISSSPPAAVTPLTSATAGTRRARSRPNVRWRSADERAGRRRGRAAALVALEVAAGAEGAAVAGDEHGPHRRVGLDPRRVAASSAVQHLRVDRVELVGPVQPDDARPRRRRRRSATCSTSYRSSVGSRHVHPAPPAPASARDDLVLLDLARRGGRQRVEHLEPLRAACSVARPAGAQRGTPSCRSRAMRPARSTTHAHMRSPSRSSGRPITAARSTSGNATSSSSISRGAMLRPPRMMISFLRPTTVR